MNNSFLGVRFPRKCTIGTRRSLDSVRGAYTSCTVIACNWMRGTGEKFQWLMHVRFTMLQEDCSCYAIDIVRLFTFSSDSLPSLVSIEGAR
ncbi:hypothetical protein M405DRAFT_186317 [Rhizopogon salebrosus TDB-379]|nr:hypothetical protein M405DRAFT_186317 [Rhizopogon salebrosus TDB-379]